MESALLDMSAAPGARAAGTAAAVQQASPAAFAAGACCTPASGGATSMACHCASPVKQACFIRWTLC